jgi:hypothetical protein
MAVRFATFKNLQMKNDEGIWHLLRPVLNLTGLSEADRVHVRSLM